MEYDADMVLCGKKDVGLITHEFHYPDMEVGYDGIGEVLGKVIAVTPVSVPWGKIFDARIIQQNGLRFDETMYVGEDSVFVHEYLMHCKNLRFISYSGYCYWHDYCENKYLMDEKQATDFLTKVLTALDNLCSTFKFSNKQLVAQNYLFAINRVLLNQSIKHPFSLMDLSKPKRFLETIPVDDIPIEYPKNRQQKVVLFLLRHHAYTSTTLLWRFAGPLYKKIKSILKNKVKRKHRHQA